VRVLGFVRAGDARGEDVLGRSNEILGECAQLAALIVQHDVHEVIVALPPDNEQLAKSLVPIVREQGVGLRIVPDVIELAATRATLENLDGIPVIRLRDSALNPLEQAEKRLLDIVVSGTLLLLLSPLLVLIAIAIRLDSPGPVLYRAPRVGRGGRVFMMYKLRSMVQDAERRRPDPPPSQPPGGLVFKLPGDPRVTRLGRFLRRTSVDELPQLVNVLRGDMTLVGPRPEQPWIVETYQPWQRRRLDVRPGMTGWWQVSGRDLPMNLHTEYDLYYLDNYSLSLDAKILVKTLWAVVHGRGAY
jgi:exopolysaccharide biosynthesis polyprenyl glycosylphosphotransferase